MKRNLFAYWFTVLACVAGVSRTFAEPQEVIRYKDADGNTVFTDYPPANVDSVERVVIDPDPSFIMPDAHYDPNMFATPKAEKSKQPGPWYTKFEFVSPVNDSATRSNDGVLSYSLVIEPGLISTHEVKVMLDGKPVSTGLSGSISDVFRGSHSLQAEIVDKSTGDTVQRAAPVTVHVQKHTINRNRPASSR